MYQEPYPKRTPPAWYWYVALCVLGALANFGLLAMGVWYLGLDDRIVAETRQTREFVQLYGFFLIFVGALFGIGNLILPFLPKKPWIYVLHLVNIVAAGLSICCLPLALPLFIYWLKPDVKEMFDFR